jgi:hypothetical protein
LRPSWVFFFFPFSSVRGDHLDAFGLELALVRLYWSVSEPSTDRLIANIILSTLDNHPFG